MKISFQDVIDAVVGKRSSKHKKRTFQRLVQVADLPDFMQGYERLKGVYVGGCILDPNGEWDKTHTAHAHCHKGDPGLGYICCMNEKKFSSNLLLKHELAHILSRDTHNKGHGREWAAVYVSLKDPSNKWLTIQWLKQKYKWKTKKKDQQDAHKQLASSCKADQPGS